MRLDADKISVGTWSSRITGQSTEQQKVETQVIESKNVIVIQQANPQVIYVPSYDPVVVWGPPIYPYPPIYYPTGYYVAGVALSFGMGAMMGAFWSGGWGWGCRWGGTTSTSIATTISIATRISAGGTAAISGTDPRIPSRAEVIAATLVGEIERRLFRPVGAHAIHGKTTRNTVAELRIETVQPPMGLAALREVIRLPTAKPARGSRLAEKGEGWPATAEEEAA